MRITNACGKEEWGEKPRESVTCEAVCGNESFRTDKPDTPEAVRVSAVTGNRVSKPYRIRLYERLRLASRQTVFLLRHEGGL